MPETFNAGRYPSGQRGQTVNLLAHAFGGSNPSLPTILRSPERSDGCVKKDAASYGRQVLRRTTESKRARVCVTQIRSLTRGGSSVAEHQPSKLVVAGSNPVPRSSLEEVRMSRNAVDIFFLFRVEVVDIGTPIAIISGLIRDRNFPQRILPISSEKRGNDCRAVIVDREPGPEPLG